MHAVLGACALSALAAFAAYQATGGVDWRVMLALIPAVVFGVLYGALRRQEPSQRWVLPLGLATILLTEMNLMATVLEQIMAPGRGKAGLADPAAVFLMLILGTVWALRVHLDVKGFCWAAATSLIVLWLPWVAFTDAPAEFLMMALACLGAGAQMRWIAEQRAYDVYRRETVWPQLWQRHVADVLAEREEDERLLAPPRNEDEMESSFMSLALALEKRRAEAEIAAEDANRARRVDSQG